MLINFTKIKTTINLDNFDCLAIEESAENTSSKYKVVAKKFFPRISTSTDPFASEGISKVVIKAFPPDESDAAEELYKNLQSAWLEKQSMYTIDW